MHHPKSFHKENEREIYYRAVESFCEAKGGKRLPKGSELISKANSHPYIRVRDFNNASALLLSSEMPQVDDETQSSISRYVVNTSDVITSVVGTIGLTAHIGKRLMEQISQRAAASLLRLKVTLQHGQISFFVVQQAWGALDLEPMVPLGPSFH